MRSVETPQYVIDAVYLIATWLRMIDAAEVLISPQGDAAWHPERQAGRLLAGWKQAEERADRAQAELLQHLQRDYDYVEMQNVIHILLEGLDEYWMTTNECRAAVVRAMRFLEAHNALS